MDTLILEPETVESTSIDSEEIQNNQLNYNISKAINQLNTGGSNQVPKQKYTALEAMRLLRGSDDGSLFDALLAQRKIDRTMENKLK